jgi:hypothetical protein
MGGSGPRLIALSNKANRAVVAGLLLAATVGLGAGSASAVTQPSEPSFVQADNPVGRGGADLTTGDVNGDGHLDLVTANQVPNQSPSVSLLVGNGDGTFGSHVDYPVPAAGGVKLVDLNGDGFDDLVVASGSAGLTVLMANGDGTLAAGVSYAPGLSPTGWDMGDVNGDGHIDVVVATSSGISVLAGNGDGTLGAPTPVYASADVDDMALADVNGDGILDLLTAETPVTSASVVRVLLGDGQGGFTPQGLMVFSGGATQLGPLVTADLNGDGHLDVIVADFVGGPVAVFLGNGDGSFGPNKQFSAGQTPRSIAAGDLNGDGIVDLAIVDAGSFTRLFLGRGDGTFAQSAFAVGSPSDVVTMGDFNHDSDLDFAVATRQNTTLDIPDDVRVLMNTTHLHLDRPTATCGDGQATVSWTAPANTSAVTGYVVTAYHNYIPGPTVTFNSTVTTQTITGLHNGFEYGFQVAALTAGFSGPASKTSNPHVFPSTPTPPLAPTIGSATPGNTEATVSWTAPTPDPCWPITGYVVTPYVGYWALPPQTFNSTAMVQTVTGLTNGTSYRLRVQAINVTGAGGYSKVTNPVTPTP